MILALAVSPFGAQRNLDDLKAEADKASGGKQARLCMEVADELVNVADQQFTNGNNPQAQATIQEVLKYAGKARDAAVNGHTSLKETEIHLRQTQRHLEALKRTLAVEDRPPLDQVEKRIEQLRQDLLDVMFGAKKRGG
jgi:hypothetical protein